MMHLSSNEIRQKYLDFFQSRGHAVIKGASLIPENDSTVLFTTAGMHPLVPYLLGEKHPAGKRLTNVQRCIRTQDIDEVGDASHLTCFEMLGNWSLGDYFKKEAIEMSYEFLTEVLKIDPNMLAVSCFAGDKDAPKDEEAASVWESTGIPKDRIAFLPKSDNWWGPAGLTGPCGPDTEMFYFVGTGKPNGNPSLNPTDWMEIWNDVFMQYNKNEDGTFTPLAQQNVDTGMGLERTAAVLQGVKNVYETDILSVIYNSIINLSPIRSEDKKSELIIKSARIISDHIRAAVFIIGDGVTPSNVDQGYVLRKLIRRAIRQARNIHPFDENFSFCSQISDIVIKQYQGTYGHLKENQKHIRDTIALEEQRFLQTLVAGEKQFKKMISSSQKILSGNDAFHLYDTYGFPIELTMEMAKELGVPIDKKAFDEAFVAHQDKSRAGAEKKFSGGLADNGSETTKLHTATHLLNAALRKVLGEHVYQKGSNITAERLRFDFSHNEKMTPKQLSEVEKLVNEAIAADLPVHYHISTPDKAKEEGAIGVFGDRYESKVKVYVIGKDSDPFSKEICGGPHVARTGMIGKFTIKKEESSSAGVRRIKATIEGGKEDIEFATEINSKNN